MDTFRYKTKKDAAAAAGKGVTRLMMKARARSVLLLLSGGSALDVLDHIHPDAFGARSTIAVLDERYTRDPALNNFAQFKNKKIYVETQKRGVHYIDTRPIAREEENEEIIIERVEELAVRFEKELRKWKKENPQGTVVAIQGIGQDGHTAGIMPYPLQREKFETLFEKPAVWVVGYDIQATAKKQPDSSLHVDKENLRKSPRSLAVFPGDTIMFRGTSSLFKSPDLFVGAVKSLWSSRLSSVGGGVFPVRVTTTFPFLRDQIDYSIVYIVGQNKRATLERVLMERKRIWEVPARILHQMKHVTVFTDIS